MINSQDNQFTKLLREQSQRQHKEIMEEVKKSTDIQLLNRWGAITQATIDFFNALEDVPPKIQAVKELTQIKNLIKERIKRNKMTEIQKIEAITKDILAGFYGTTQKCGTETQKWQYAHNQARRIFDGELIIDPLYTPVIWI